MRNLAPWVLVMGVLAVLAVAAYALVNGLHQATQPLLRVGSEIGTQASQLLNPTPTILPDPVTIVREVRSLARLETIKYAVEKIISAETGQGAFGFLFGDRLLFVAHGYVIAGVDLSKLTAEEVGFDELGWVYISLPEAEVFVAALDNERSYVYHRDTGLLTHGEVSLEASARQVAEGEILNSALEDGILDQARVNAESYLYRFLRSLGFSDVFFVGAGEIP